jgi:ketosteroid isomerase-like protein
MPIAPDPSRAYGNVEALMDAEAAARRWADTWQRAWEARDLDAILALYAPDAIFSSQPFREPYRGREGVRAYVAQAFADEEDPRVWVGEPVVAGDRASVSWWASLREDGADTTLAGTSVIRFDREGLVAEQWDAWNLLGERREPPDWAPFRRRDA